MPTPLPNEPATPDAFPIRRVVSTLIWLFVLISAVGLAIWFYLYQVYYSSALLVPMPKGAPTTFEINTGESVSTIAARLKKAAIVHDDWVLTQYLTRNQLDQKIEAGFFQFAGTETIPEVAEKLQHGGSEQMKLTVLEGWSSADIDAKLLKLKLIQTPGAFSSLIRSGTAIRPAFAADRPTPSLEGYLFPATYYIDPKKFQAVELAQRMLDTMEQKLTEIGYTPASSTRSLHAILTMASIIELEERDPVKQPLVADILWRRLDNGWQLGADATIFYQIGHRDNLTIDDLNIDSPYNTRKNKGLPPTPVALPSLSAITAALHPQANQYWYYLHDTQGLIHFAIDGAEHEANKRKYL